MSEDPDVEKLLRIKAEVKERGAREILSIAFKEWNDHDFYMASSENGYGVEALIKLWKEKQKKEMSEDKMYVVFDAEKHVLTKEELLKSLGLYWRRWPEEKPVLYDRVLLGAGFYTYNDCYYFKDNLFALFKNGSEMVEDSPCICPKDGDLWFPLATLEMLK